MKKERVIPKGKHKVMVGSKCLWTGDHEECWSYISRNRVVGARVESAAEPFNKEKK